MTTEHSPEKTYKVRREDEKQGSLDTKEMLVNNQDTKIQCIKSHCKNKPLVCLDCFGDLVEENMDLKQVIERRYKEFLEIIRNNRDCFKNDIELEWLITKIQALTENKQEKN